MGEDGPGATRARHAPGSTHAIRRDEPASGFLDAFLLGNGRLGAVVHGRPGVERFDLDADTLWSGGPLAPDTDPPARPGALADVRRAIAERRFEDADRLAEELHGSRFSASYEPAGALLWEHATAPETAAAGSGTGYERELALDEALARARYADPGGGRVDVVVGVSGPAGVLVAEARGAVVDPGLRYDGPHPGTVVETSTDADGRTWLVATGRAPVDVVPSYLGAVDEPVRYAEDAPDADGLVDAGTGFAVVAATERTGPDAVRLVATVVTGFRGYRERPSADVATLAREGREQVAAALARPTDALVRELSDDHARWYDRAALHVGRAGAASDDAAPADAAAAAAAAAADAVRYFNLGRYLLVAGSRPGTQALNLQGIWNVDVRPAWSCNYTTNINVQMAYWPADVVGLGELAEPLHVLVRELAESGREVAERHYGLRGSAVHHNADLWRIAAGVPLPAQWGSWPSALWWLSAQVDDARVDELGVDLALDLLVEGDDGLLVVSPSTSPENRFVTPSGGRAAVSAGTALDQELVHEVLTRYLARPAVSAGGSERGARAGSADVATASDADRRARARAALDRLRLPATGSDGALLEWAEERVPEEVGHRHLSHLYGLFPGTRITETGTPAEFAAARRALQVRLDHGSGGTGWSQAWVLCLAARLRDPALAAHSLDVLIRRLASPSLLDLHPADNPDGFVFQIDGNLGGAAGIAELLLQSHEGVVGLLRTLPVGWEDGRFRGFCTRDGHTVDAEWADGRLTRARVVVARPGRVTVECPGGPGDADAGPAGRAWRVVGPAGPVAADVAPSRWGEGRVEITWDVPPTGAGASHLVEWAPRGSNPEPTD